MSNIQLISFIDIDPETHKLQGMGSCMCVLVEGDDRQITMVLLCAATESNTKIVIV